MYGKVPMHALVGTFWYEEADMDDDFEYQVRHRAYELWVAGGRPDGKHQQYWELAERELKTRHERSNGETMRPLYPETPDDE